MSVQFLYSTVSCYYPPIFIQMQLQFTTPIRSMFAQCCCICSSCVAVFFFEIAYTFVYLISLTLFATYWLLYKKTTGAHTMLLCLCIWWARSNTLFCSIQFGVCDIIKVTYFYFLSLFVLIVIAYCCFLFVPCVCVCIFGFEFSFNFIFINNCVVVSVSVLLPLCSYLIYRYVILSKHVRSFLNICKLRYGWQIPTGGFQPPRSFVISIIFVC